MRMTTPAHLDMWAMGRLAMSDTDTLGSCMLIRMHMRTVLT